MPRGADLARPKSTAELIAVLKREAKTRRDNIRLAKFGSVGLVLGLVGLALVAYVRNGTPVLTTLTDLSPFFLVAMGGVVLNATHRRALLEVRADYQGCVGFLIEALTYHDADVADHAEHVLAMQLPFAGALAA